MHLLYGILPYTTADSSCSSSIILSYLLLNTVNHLFFSFIPPWTQNCRVVVNINILAYHNPFTFVSLSYRIVSKHVLFTFIKEHFIHSIDLFFPTLFLCIHISKRYIDLIIIYILNINNIDLEIYILALVPISPF